ncbi:MAG TPA: TonB-dependent receptor [Steroidobacteraceae bacterium]|nr:TonB-dependent receptor [Steroidobacteraceae bacterium]
MFQRRPNLIRSAVLAALAGHAGVTYGQAAVPTEELEEIVVTGIRSSYRASLETKREETAVVDAITAEDVTKFPDKNLAEALQRVPGVTLNREFGEGERINIRGTDDSLTKMLLNGHSLATADWFVLDQLNSTRSFNYLMLPADIIGEVKVFKTQQADLEEGGIGGTVDVITRNPLDLAPMTLSGTLQGAYSQLADETDPQASALFSWKNTDSTFGVLVAGVYQKRTVRRDGVEVLGYFDADPSDTGELLAPSLIGSALFQQERERIGGNVAVQFQPNESLLATLTGLYSKFDGDNVNENFMAWGSRALANGGTLAPSAIQDGTAVAGTIESRRNATTGALEDFGVVYDAIDRIASTDTSNIDLDVEWALNDAWNFHFRAGRTEANGDTEAQPFVEFGAPASFTYDLRGKAPQVSYANIDPTDPTDLQFIFSSLHQILNDDSETYAYADAETEVGLGFLDSIKFGAKYTDHDRELRFNATTYGGFHVPINTLPASTFAGAMTPGDFLDAIKATGTIDRYWQINRNEVERILFDNLRNGPGRVLYPQQSFSIAEDVAGGYLMANLKGERWRGNVGVRYVRTEQTSNGNVVSPTGAIENPYGNYDPISVDRNYDNWLPSLNLAFDFTDELVGRFAAARTMTRPDFTDIAPRASLNPGALTAQTGNPDLDPFEADQFDVSLEWYHDDDAAIVGALFYKDIKSFITDSVQTINFNINTASPPSLECVEVGTDLWSCPFTTNVRSNGGGGKVQGFEFAVNQPIAAGFGFNANYTYSDAEADNGDPIPGNSENTYNVVAYYENPRLGARLAYTYRDDFFVTFDRSTELNQDGFGQLDASVSVGINDNIALTFDAQNLTEEEIVQYAGSKARPRAIYDNGRVFYFGVRMKY